MENSQVIKIVVSKILEEMLSVRSEVRSITTAIEKSQEFLADKFDTILADFRAIKAENESLKLEIAELKRLHSSLANTVHTLECKVHKTDQNAISKHAVIAGVPCTPEENVDQISRQVFEHVGIKLDSDAITSAARMFHSNKANSLVPITVVFKSKSDKDKILQKKVKLGN